MKKINQINSVCQKLYNNFNNIDSQMNRNNYDLNNLVRFKENFENKKNK